MKHFLLARFVALMVRVLEIGIIAALAFRWFDATIGFWDKITLPRAVYETVSNFSFLAILLLLLATLWFLFTRQPRASVLALRTSIYILALILSPTRLPASADSQQHSSVIHYASVRIMTRVLDPTI